MKRIGILGGMSYESTLHYYEQINREVNERAGGLVSADLVLRSVNFAEYYTMMKRGDWDTIGSMLSREAKALCLFGDVSSDSYCDYIAIATNTMHKVAPIIEESLLEMWIWDHDNRIQRIQPKSTLIHIGDCIADECKKIRAKQVLLLGTKFTMTEDFMKLRLYTNGVNTMDISNYPNEVNEIDRIIFEELCRGTVTTKSKRFMIDFINRFQSNSGDKPDAIILGCTELNMILKPEDTDVINLPLIDSTQVHIKKIVDLCLSE